MRDIGSSVFASVAALAIAGVMTGPAPAWARAAHARPGPAVASSVEAVPNAALPSSDVLRLGEWATSSGDNHGHPFVIVDKPDAEVFVFDANGLLLGSAPALLGSALGDDAAAGVGDEKLSQIPLDERTTEAGRFVAHMGPAKGMPSVLWVDFDTALSLHPVVTSNPEEHRLQRLSSPSPDDRRITHGCINVPARFYREVVHKTFADTDGVVYILPDTKSPDAVFPQAGLQANLDASLTGRQRDGGSLDRIAETLGEETPGDR